MNKFSKKKITILKVCLVHIFIIFLIDFNFSFFKKKDNKITVNDNINKK